MNDPDPTAALTKLIAVAIRDAPDADPQALRALAEHVIAGGAQARERLGLLLATALAYALAGDSEVLPKQKRPKAVADDVFKPLP